MKQWNPLSLLGMCSTFWRIHCHTNEAHRHQNYMEQSSRPLLQTDFWSMSQQFLPAPEKQLLVRNVASNASSTFGKQSRVTLVPVNVSWSFWLLWMQLTQMFEPGICAASCSLWHYAAAWNILSTGAHKLHKMEQLLGNAAKLSDKNVNSHQLLWHTASRVSAHSRACQVTFLDFAGCAVPRVGMLC